MYQLIYKKKALKSLGLMPKPIAARFNSAFHQIASGQTMGLDIKPMVGFDAYRLRIGTYRAVYEINNNVLTVTVFNIESRGGVYK